MDLKKIDIRTVFSFLDDLARKVPPIVSSILTKVVIVIFVGMVVYAASYGWQIGSGYAEQQGLELAKSTRMLFSEEIERDYNRKRKNIKMPSAESLLGDSLYNTKKTYEFSGRVSEEKPDSKILEEDKKIIETEQSIRSLKTTTKTPPLIQDESNYKNFEKSSDDLPGTSERNYQNSMDEYKSIKPEKNLKEIDTDLKTDKYTNKILDKAKDRKPFINPKEIPKDKMDTEFKQPKPESKINKKVQPDILPLDN